MTDLNPYTENIWRMVISKIFNTIGFHSISSVGLQVLIDVAHKYLREICVTLHNCTELYGRTVPTLEDMSLVTRQMNINITDLDEYMQYVSSINLNVKIPKYPVEVPSNLNFLKPGSREVVTRPVHIHEHLPAMYPELSEEDYPIQTSFTDHSFCGLPDLINNSSQLSFNKSDDFNNETCSPVKISKLENERVVPLRELHSVMMTTSGFLSPAREGKLPESRIPGYLLNAITSQSSLPASTSSSSLLPSCPTTAPEGNNGHKIKSHRSHKNKNSDLKSPQKKMRLEQRDKVENLKEPEEKKVKKLPVMKELSKLKPLKQTAFKLLEPSISITPFDIKSKSEKVKPTPCDNSYPAKKEHKELKQHKSLNHEKSYIYNYEKQFMGNNENQFSDVYDEPEQVKLTSQPDQQKLSIFKRISKPKEERTSSSNIFQKKLFEKYEKREKYDTMSSWNDRTIFEKYGVNSRSDCSIHETIEAVIKGTKDNSGKDWILDPKKETKSKKESQFEDFQSIKRKKPDLSDTKIKKTKKKRKHNIEELTIPVEHVGEEQEVIIDDTVDNIQDDQSFSQTDMPMFPFYSHLTSSVELISSPISQNPLIPRFPAFHTLNTNSSNLTVPNLPLPPPPNYLNSVLEANQKLFVSEHTLSELETEILDIRPSDKEKKIKKDHKKLKKDKKDKEKKKREKKEKLKQLKLQRKEEQKKEKDCKKSKNKDESRIKKDKTKREKDVDEYQKVESVVPKLKLKLGSSSPQLSPTTSQSPKITIKPIIKRVDEPKMTEFIEAFPSRKESKQIPSPEVILADVPVSKPVKHKSKIQHTVTPSTSKLLVEPITISIQTTKEKHTKSKVKEKATKSKKKSEPITDTRPEPFYFDSDGNQIWVCPSCGAQDDGSPMIGCDGCDAWYHWVCVGIKAAPESKKWFCSYCKR